MTKREELGAAIQSMREDMGITRHTLSDKTNTSNANVERWERGLLCPTKPEFSRMCVVLRKLDNARYRELYAQAAAEQLAEVNGASQAVVHAAPDLDAAVQLVVDALPALRSMSIEVDDERNVRVSYRTRELRVVEDEGSLTIRRPKP